MEDYNLVIMEVRSKIKLLSGFFGELNVYEHKQWETWNIAVVEEQKDYCILNSTINTNNKHYANKHRAKNCTSANQKSLKKTR